MKKIILAIALFAIGFGMNVNAQSDGFFASSYSEYREGGSEIADLFGATPSMIGHGFTIDQDGDIQDTPVGSGLLVLAGLGLAYAIRKKN